MGVTGVPGFLESIVVPPAALSRSKEDLVAHWHSWKASGHSKRHGIWVGTSPHGDGMATALR